MPHDRPPFDATLPQVPLSAATFRALRNMAQVAGVNENELARELLAQYLDADRDLAPETFEPLDAILRPVRMPRALRDRLDQGARINQVSLGEFARRALMAMITPTP